MIYLLMSILAVSALDKRRLLDEDEMRVERSGREGLRTRGGGQGPAAFEFANSSGAGMGAACACTSPTGTKGEIMTSARATSAICSKGDPNAPVNGDLVLCSTNQPRVMSGGSGPLGLLVEAARTNYSLRSQEIDNAAWLPFFGIVAAPVITANYATAPDGTATADRVVFPSCPTPVSNYSSLYQYNASPIGAQTGTLYVKGTSGSGNLGFCLFESPGGACSTCAYTAGTWSRCTVNHTSVGGGSVTTPVFGCLNGVLGMPIGNTGAADVLVWGVQVEAGAYATSYMPTTSAGVTRAADGDNSFAPSPAPATDTAGSAAGSVLSLSSSTGLIGPIIIQGTVNRYVYMTGGGAFSTYDGVNNPSIAASFTANNTFRSWSSWTGSVLTVANKTAVTSSTSAFDGTMGNGSPLYVGVFSATFGVTSPPFVIKQICLDPNPSRCR